MIINGSKVTKDWSALLKEGHIEGKISNLISLWKLLVMVKIWASSTVNSDLVR